MINKTVALHGTKELIQQSREDLVKAGFEDYKKWNDKYSQINGFDFLVIYPDNVVAIRNHDCGSNAVIALTTENYLEEINKIISQKQQKN